MANSKILIVEDDNLIAQDLKQQLENMNYTITGIANNGEDTIKKAIKTNPDLILMDIVLKGEIDGIETAQKLQKNYDIPIIYLTAYFDDEIFERANKTQPAAYITKPYDQIALHTAIQVALYKHQNKPSTAKLICKSQRSEYLKKIKPNE